MPFRHGWVRIRIKWKEAGRRDRVLELVERLQEMKVSRHQGSYQSTCSVSLFLFSILVGDGGMDAIDTE